MGKSGVTTVFVDTIEREREEEGVKYKTSLNVISQEGGLNYISLWIDQSLSLALSVYYWFREWTNP